jgi:hypothetical protein
MSSDSSDQREEFQRAAIVAGEHPGNPLKGTVVFISTSLEISIPDPLLEAITERTKEKFDIDKYTGGLRYGTLYIDATQNEIIGARWEKSPCAYNHGDLNEPVNELPESIIHTTELVD